MLKSRMSESSFLGLAMSVDGSHSKQTGSSIITDDSAQLSSTIAITS